MPEAVSPKLFKLIPVPMRLDDPRWRASWHLKPCTVWHTSEVLARAAAGRHFQVRAVQPGILLGDPWSDPDLVVCLEDNVLNEASEALVLGSVFDLGGGHINPADATYGAVPKGELN